MLSLSMNELVQSDTATGSDMHLLRSLGVKPTQAICAPMVHQSDLSFRMLCRRYDIPLCFSPMFGCRLFAMEEGYRDRVWSTCEEDRPLIVQFAGDDPAHFVAAAKLVEDQCDGIDVNLGCPQAIARKGHYGAFLLTELDLIRSIVTDLKQNIKVPISCKIRLLDSIESTLELCNVIQDAGCDMLTVHGRTKEENKTAVTDCNFEAIKLIKENMKIPVISNGGIATLDDLHNCLRFTNADAVMSSEALLENPTMFSTESKSSSRFGLVHEYLDLADTYDESIRTIRSHMFKFLYGCLVSHNEFYQRIGLAENISEMKSVVKELESIHSSGECQIDDCHFMYNDRPGLWYMRHRAEPATSAASVEAVAA